MDSLTLLRNIYRYLDIKGLLGEFPELTKENVDDLFRQIKEELGLKEKWDKPRASSSELILYIDGAARGNPGPAAVGCVLKNSRGEDLLTEGKTIGTATNNVAEYSALLYGLDLASQFQPDKLQIYSDSELMVKQMTGVYKTRDPKMKELREIALVKLQSIEDYTFTAIPRELNSDADSLANKALDEASPGLN